MKILPDRIYDILKWVAIVAIPAIVTFLGIVLPALRVDAETVNTITTIVSACGVLLGTLLGVSTYGYNKTKNTQ